MRQIFVNLPVKDLAKSKAFFAGLGFGFDLKFTDDNAACLVIEKGSIHAMLITEPMFQTFTPRAIADAKRTSEVLLALSCSSDAYRAFEDPDGHIWELLHMRGEPK